MEQGKAPPGGRWQRWLIVALGVRQALTGEVLTQGDLAKRAGVSRQLVSQILSGQAEGVSADTLNKLATSLGSDPTVDPLGKIRLDGMAEVMSWLAQTAAYHDALALIERRIAELDQEMFSPEELETLSPEQAADLDVAAQEYDLEEQRRRRLGRGGEP